MSRFWPVAEAAQADYERLRAVVCSTGRLPDDLVTARFRRRGLAGLIEWPQADPVFWVELVGASRPAWTPYADPRLEALAATYRLLVAASEQTMTLAHDQAGHAGADMCMDIRAGEP